MRGLDYKIHFFTQKKYLRGLQIQVTSVKDSYYTIDLFIALGFH